MKKIFFILVLFFTSATYASTGYIDTSATNHAKVCYDTTCTTPTPSIINFELSQQPSITIDSVTGISGYVWGEALGWIKMNPTGAGVIFANSTTGLLTGKAWSQVSGWVNFAVTGQQVTISPSSGEFSGWAWSGGPYGGWIKFDCNDSSTCVTSTWRYVTPPPPDGVPLIDVCLNIPDLQTSIPYGYTVDNFGKCVLVVDACPNLLGDQVAIPVGYQYNEIGACIPTQIDYCQNIKGNQYVIPKGYVIDSAGDCVRAPTDFCPSDKGIQFSYEECSKKQIEKDICPNLEGVQEVLPDKYVLSGGLCYPVTFDLCPNISESQATLPIGYIVSSDGNCSLAPEDLCSNLGGSQVIVPKGFFQEGVNCFLEGSREQNVEGSSDNIRVIALPFIPSSIWIITDSTFTKDAVSFVDNILNTKITDAPYRVDLVSFSIVTVFLLIIFWFLFITIKRVLIKPVL